MFYHQDPLSKYYARLSCFRGTQVSSLTKIHEQESRHSNTTKFQDLRLKFCATRPSFQDSGSHDSSIRPKSICPTNSCGHNVCERRSRYAYFNHVGAFHQQLGIRPSHDGGFIQRLLPQLPNARLPPYAICFTMSRHSRDSSALAVLSRAL